MANDALERKPAPRALRSGLGKNPTRSRDHNRRVILDLLRQKSGLQRKDLAAAVQLSAPAVANILDDLLSEGLILDMGRAAPPKEGQRRGQPPLHFALNPRGAHTLGFEIGPRGIVAVMLDLIGQPISREILSTEAPTRAAGLAVMREKIAQAAAMEVGPLMGIGLVRPGSFTPDEQGGIDPTALKDWDDVSSEEMAQELGHAVWLENDANAAALSEALFGAAARLRNVVVLYFGEGLGLGALVDGKLLRGARGHAGEIGHILVVPEGRACSCGHAAALNAMSRAMLWPRRSAFRSPVAPWPSFGRRRTEGFWAGSKRRRAICRPWSIWSKIYSIPKALCFRGNCPRRSWRR